MQFVKPANKPGKGIYLTERYDQMQRERDAMKLQELLKSELQPWLRFGASHTQQRGSPSPKCNLNLSRPGLQAHQPLLPCCLQRPRW